ncbi:hypothetical protein CWATWH0005_622 [Crocosphaera watsonii WH 0005]|uniref:Uncharacterized protein n=1 Tax=Crocosphaera watsonii WH 0005 TaxID=423472 RepID=T2ITS3_CROWT|nr:hypothetical protein CWATWH0005_622 [Crocosphaera watsonii WH 0005]
MGFYKNVKQLILISFAVGKNPISKDFTLSHDCLAPQTPWKVSRLETREKKE